MSSTDFFLLVLVVLGLFVIAFVLVYAVQNWSRLVDWFRLQRGKVRLRKWIKQDYFALTPEDQLEDVHATFLRFLSRAYSIVQVWRSSEEDLAFDYRSFVIEDDFEEEGIPLNWSKWEIVMNRLGVNFDIEKCVERNDNLGVQDVIINGTRYTLEIDYTDDACTMKMFLDFSRMINTELQKMGSDTFTIVMDEFPSKLIFLNPTLRKSLFSGKNRQLESYIYTLENLPT
jgi:hypothetical protein